MTVSSSYTDKVYQINGTSTVFPWAQDFDKQYGSLVVTEETSSGETVTTYTEGTDYNIIERNVVFVTAPSDTTHYIRIARNTYKGQPVEFIEGENFPADDYENSLDRLAMIAQEVYKLIQDEITKRIAADEALAEAITTEENRAKGVEGNLNNLTTTTKTNLVGAVNEVNSLIGAINTLLATYGDIVTHDANEFATAAQGSKADSAVQPEDLADVATSGDYDDLSNKPTIPTVNNATITFKQGGTTKGTISLNQSENEEIDLDAGGGTVTSAITLTGVTVSIEAGTTQSSIDVSSSIESGTKYMPIVVFQEVSAVDVLKYCVFNSSTGKVVIHTNGKVVGDSNVAITLIPVESTSTTIKGLTNGIGEFEEYTAAEVETLWGSI